MHQRLFVRLDEDAVQGPESGLPRQSLRGFTVCPALRPQVSNVLLYRESFAASEEVVERVVPDGAVRLVFDWSEAPSAGRAAMAIGPSIKPAVLRLSGRMAGMAVTLRPGAAAVLLGLPAGEMAELAVPLQELWGRGDAQGLADLAALPDDASRIRAVQQALLLRLQRARPSDPRLAVHALQALTRTAGRAKVRDVASSVGVGERRLQQLFDAHIGLSPRSWSRLARLHQCLRELRRQPGKAWPEVALDGGFFDQSHLINEFRALCGCTPAEFRRMAVSHSSKTGP
ncbi:MAG TPA: helix-turn-helix domain-containing protein [Ideonella sp.]|nr:helix-turn-helix domain-containing protein [Ideonella sp.]